MDDPIQPRPDALDHGLNDPPGREVLARAAFHLRRPS